MLTLKCDGCSKRTASTDIETYQDITDKGEVFKKNLCPKCIKEIVNDFREHIKAKEEALKKTHEA